MVREKTLFDRGADYIKFLRLHPCIAAQELLNVDLPPPQRLILRGMWFKPYVLVTAGRGCGKCVDGNTIIPTDKGLVYIDSLGSKLNPLSDVSFDVVGKDDIDRSTKWYYNGVDKVNKITTNFGYSISGTDEHRLIVLNEKGFMEWKCSSAISEGDILAINRKTQIWSQENKCSEEEATFLGLITGDGCTRGNKYSLSFSNGDKETLHLYKYLVSGLFGEKARYNDSNGTRCGSYVTTKKYIWEKLETLGLFNHTPAKDKFIPWSVMQSGKYVMASFLKALFECDGGCEKNRVSYCTVSKRLAKEVHIALLNFGIVSNLRKKEVKYNGGINISYVIEITSNNIDLYRDEIGFLSDRKKDSLDNLCGKKRNPNVDVVYNLEDTMYHMWNNTRGVLHYTKRDLLKKYKNSYYNPGYASLKKILKLYPYNDIYKEHIEDLVNKNYFFDKVVSVEEEYTDTYDLVVPESKSFVANGFVNHNTFLLSVLCSLYGLLFPGKKILIVSPSFRQSKMVFDEVEQRYIKSPILREATAKKPTTGADRCYLNFRAVENKAGSIIQAIPLGDGCVVSSTYVTTSEGILSVGDFIKVDDLYKDHQVFDNGKAIWSYGEFRNSDEKYYNGIRHVKKITTKKGYSFSATLNHKIKIVRDGNIVWEQLENINEGDWVLLDRTDRWFDNSDLTVSEDEAYTLGLLLGDGCWTNEYRIRFTTKDRELAEHLSGCFVKDFYKCSDGVHYNLDSKTERSDWLEKWGIGCLYTKDKYLPRRMLSASKKSMSACLRGLYDTDGHIQVSGLKGGTAITIGLTNTSERLIDQVHYILLHYGIVSCKTSRERNKKWNTVYELLITGSDVKKFYRCIGFGLKRKQDLLYTAVSNKKRWVSSSDVIPSILDESIEYRKNTKITRGFGGVAASRCRVDILKDHTELVRTSAKNLLRIYEDKSDSFIERLKLLSDDDIFYDRVESVDYDKTATFDLHVPYIHEYCASGFFSHNSKIRGLRGHLIVTDEFAQVPEEIFDMVIRPMGATVTDPMEKVRRLEELKENLASGYLTQEEFDAELAGQTSNKIICTSSAYYTFNHMYRRIQAYEQKIEEGNKNYGVHYVSYKDMPPAFLDIDNIDNAKSTMSKSAFSIEYDAIWESDSDGVFKASLIDACRNSKLQVKLKADAGRKYIMGVDPARSSDAFAIVVIEVGNPSSIVYATQAVGKKFPEMAQTIFDLCDRFCIGSFMMDAGSGGGGIAIKDLLANEQFFKGRLILDKEDEEYKNVDGRKILRMHDPKPKSIAEAVYASVNLLEQNLLNFPYPPYEFNEEKEDVYSDIQTMIKQMMAIVVTETKTGQAHFDIPATGGGSRKKDLYSAFVLAAKCLYDEITAREDDFTLVNKGGLIIPVDRGEFSSGPRITHVMSVSNRGQYGR